MHNVPEHINLSDFDTAAQALYEGDLVKLERLAS
jgi:hypothetical protein